MGGGRTWCCWGRALTILRADFNQCMALRILGVVPGRTLGSHATGRTPELRSQRCPTRCVAGLFARSRLLLSQCRRGGEAAVAARASPWGALPRYRWGARPRSSRALPFPYPSKCDCVFPRTRTQRDGCPLRQAARTSPRPGPPRFASVAVIAAGEPCKNVHDLRRRIAGMSSPRSSAPASAGVLVPPPLMARLGGGDGGRYAAFGAHISIVAEVASYRRPRRPWRRPREAVATRIDHMLRGSPGLRVAPRQRQLGSCASRPSHRAPRRCRHREPQRAGEGANWTVPVCAGSRHNPPACQLGPTSAIRWRRTVVVLLATPMAATATASGQTSWRRRKKPRQRSALAREPRRPCSGGATRSKNASCAWGAPSESRGHPGRHRGRESAFVRTSRRASGRVGAWYATPPIPPLAGRTARPGRRCSSSWALSRSSTFVPTSDTQRTRRGSPQTPSCAAPPRCVPSEACSALTCHAARLGCQWSASGVPP